jgi:hypothetical protein
VDDVVMARLARVHHEIIIALRGSGLPDLSAVLCPNDDEEGDFA